MKADSMAKAEAIADRRCAGTRGRWGPLAAIATFLLAPAAMQAAAPEDAGTAGTRAPVTFESIAGSPHQRVILSARAAERLGIETGVVSEQVVVRTQMVGGLVVGPVAHPPERAAAGGGLAGFGRVAAAPGSRQSAPGPTPGAAGDVWVRVSLSPAEWDRLAKDKPARLLALATRDALAGDVYAQPSGMPPVEDLKRSMLSVHYVVAGKAHGLAPNERLRVELPLAGSDKVEKVVPYAAVYYDQAGNPCVYVAMQPLAFERRGIRIERIAGDLAVLAEGPPVGTRVVTVGAALLHGAEVYGK